MRITVVGPGAIGCLLAGYLARAGEKVWLLDYRLERTAVLAQKGISIEGERGGFHTAVRATADPAEAGNTEVIIFCVKSGETRAVGLRLHNAVSPESHFLTLQNGLGNLERLAELFGRERVFAGVTSHGATLLETGRVRHAGYGQIWLGRTGEAEAGPASQNKLERLVASLERAGLQPRLVEDIQPFIWRKLLVNVGINALTAILRLPNGRLLGNPECQSLMERAVAEGVQVARLCGIHLDEAEEVERTREVCRTTGANISSMLQDVRRRKRTEVDYINGAVVRLATRHGVGVPVNEVLTALVRAIEAGYGPNMQGPQ